MKWRLFAWCILLAISESCFGQRNIDSINIENGKNVLEKFEGNNLSNFLLYSVNEDFILLKPCSNNLKVWYINISQGLLDSAVIRDKKLKKKLFQSFKCTKCYSYSASEQIAQNNYWHKGFIYCLLVKDGIKISESSLPSLFQLKDTIPDIYPIGNNLNDYLFSMVLNFSYKHNARNP